MTLEQIVYDIETRLLNLGRLLWRPDPLAPVQEEADRLEARLRERRSALSLCEAERAALQRRLTDNQIAAARLTSQIETCLHRGAGDQAWKHALELDHVRQALAADQASQPRYEQTCWSLQFQVRQFERQRARLRETLSGQESGVRNQ